MTAERDSALLDLLRALRALAYDFVTVTPETHRRVLARDPARIAGNLRDVFGWSLPFEPDLLPEPVAEALERSGMIEARGPLRASLVRVSTLEGSLFLHSAYPTDGADAVFLGPDSYRFASFVKAELIGAETVRRIVDVGAGAGVGAISAASIAPGARLTLCDVNPLALRMAGVNARFAGLEIEAVEASGLAGVQGPLDLVIANPPFVIDAAKRQYRDGGGMRGASMSLEWALEAAHLLRPGGRMLLYTGSAVVGGRDGLREALERDLPALGCSLRYAEIDPDIFGELVETPGYEEVERIAAVGAVIAKG